jgi:hypothetical protein
MQTLNIDGFRCKSIIEYQTGLIECFTRETGKTGIVHQPIVTLDMQTLV